MTRRHALSILVMLLLFFSCSSDDPDQSSDDLAIEDNIYVGNLYIGRQATVTFFGNKKFTEIQGNLRISSQLSDPIVDLSLLHTIKKVKYLEVYSNPKLKNLDGLENIKFESAHVESCAILENVNALQINDGYEGGIGLSYLPMLTNYDVFRGIEKLDFLTLGGLPLDNLEPFKDLRRINRSLSLSRMNGLENLSGLQLDYVGDDFIIQKNQALISLSGLESILEVGPYGKMEIYLNPLLTDYCALDQILTAPHFADQEAWYVWGNEYNPTRQDVIDGNCN